MLVATAGNASVFALDVFVSREFVRPVPRHSPSQQMLEHLFSLDTLMCFVVAGCYRGRLGLGQFLILNGFFL
jgi:hypothetical protein